MLISDYKNIFDPIKLVLLRTPMVVPKWGHMESICPPLGLAYVAASIQQAGYEVSCLDALGEAPFQRNVLEEKNLISFGLSTEQILRLVQVILPISDLQMELELWESGPRRFTILAPVDYGIVLLHKQGGGIFRMLPQEMLLLPLKLKPLPETKLLH